LLRALRSPWLFYDNQQPSCIGFLASENVQYGARGLGYGADGRVHNTQFAWRTFLYDLNTRASRTHTSEGSTGDSIPHLVSPSLNVSDLRDSFISFAYRNSGYQWLVAKLAAGHSSLGALTDYLRKHRWRAHGEAQVRKLQSALWSEIRERQVVDPAILHALVQRGEVSDVQRQRWLDHKDRTRVGMGCRDFYHPPREIAPEHKEGSGCRIQRCTLCRHGIVFSDSIELLARRLAELTWLRARIPLMSWIESSFPDELESLEATLELFDKTKVLSASESWKREIEGGRHRVLDQEGSYDA
jgi:hypothetical protein